LFHSNPAVKVSVLVTPVVNVPYIPPSKPHFKSIDGDNTTGIGPSQTVYVPKSIGLGRKDFPTIFTVILPPPDIVIPVSISTTLLSIKFFSS